MEKEAAALAADVRAREAAEAEVAHMKQAARTCKQAEKQAARTCKQEEGELIKGEAEAEPVAAKLAEREREREEVAAKVKQLRLERAQEKELEQQLKQEREAVTEATAARELQGLVPPPQSLASTTIAPTTPPTRVEQAQASTTPPGKPRPGMSWTVDEAADAVKQQPNNRDTSSLPADPVADCSQETLQAQVAANQDDGRENRELRLPMVPRLNLSAVEDKIEAAREDALKQAVTLCCAVALHVLLLHFLAHVQTVLQAVSCGCMTAASFPSTRANWFARCILWVYDSDRCMHSIRKQS